MTSPTPQEPPCGPHAPRGRPTARKPPRDPMAWSLQSSTTRESSAAPSRAAPQEVVPIAA
jgi:hypothetical protein